MTTPEQLRAEINTIRKSWKQMEADTESCIAQMEEAWKTRSTEMLMRLNKLKAQYRQLNHCDHPKVDRCNWADAQECLVCGEIIEYEKKHD